MRLNIFFNFVPWLLWGLLCHHANGLDARGPFNLNKKSVQTGGASQIYNSSQTYYKQPSISCSTHHVIKSGDTCWDIKNRYGITLDKVYELNQGIECSNLVVGDQLCVASNLPPPAPSKCTHFWIVSIGDICYNIASKLQMSLDALLSLNPGLDCDNLRIDQRLCMKHSESGGETRKVGFVKRSLSNEKSTPKGCKKFHTVERGESCWDIALNNGLDLANFLKLNKDLDCDPLFAGYKVCVDNNTPTTTCQKGYRVKSGDTCFKIANMYSMSIKELLARNPELNCNLLQINKTVCISEASREATRAPVATSSKKEEGVKPATTVKDCAPLRLSKCSHHYVPDYDLSCEEIAKAVGLQGISDLLALNPGMNCNQKKGPSQKICIKIPMVLKCSLYYIGHSQDTEQSISNLFGLLPNVLTLINNKKIQTVAPNQLVCVQMNINQTATVVPSEC